MGSLPPTIPELGLHDAVLKDDVEALAKVLESMKAASLDDEHMKASLDGDRNEDGLTALMVAASRWPFFPTTITITHYHDM